MSTSNTQRAVSWQQTVDSKREQSFFREYRDCGSIGSLFYDNFNDDNDDRDKFLPAWKQSINPLLTSTLQIRPIIALLLHKNQESCKLGLISGVLTLIDWYVLELIGVILCVVIVLSCYVIHHYISIIIFWTWISRSLYLHVDVFARLDVII